MNVGRSFDQLRQIGAARMNSRVTEWIFAINFKRWLANRNRRTTEQTDGLWSKMPDTSGHTYRIYIHTYMHVYYEGTHRRIRAVDGTKWMKIYLFVDVFVFGDCDVLICCTDVAMDAQTHFHTNASHKWLQQKQNKKKTCGMARAVAI